MENYCSQSKKILGEKPTEANLRPSKTFQSTDGDTAIFIRMSQELRDEGNRLFQMRDYEGAMLKYEKAIKLLPRNHLDVSYLRSNMAACYMQLGIGEYPRAIHECNLALEVTPKYSKALLKRARCYEALNRLHLALRDVGTVLEVEQNNLMANEIAERVRNSIERQGSRVNELSLNAVPLPEYIEPPSPHVKLSKGKSKKKKSYSQGESRFFGEIEDDQAGNEMAMKGKFKDRETSGDEFFVGKSEDWIEEETTDDKLVVEEKRISKGADKGPRRTVKLVLGDDIRWAHIPLNCSILRLREVISDRFPNSKAILVKYRDQEGDLVTITTTEELRWAEASTEHASLKLYIVEVSPEQDPFFQEKLQKKQTTENAYVGEKKQVRIRPTCISDWIIQFAIFFKNYIGFDADAYLDLHEVGMKVYSEAMEEAVTSEEAQELFSIASDKFQEMGALALFNWGNVHMSRARKRVHLPEDAPRETVLARIKIAYDWAQNEYTKAGTRYEEALQIKPNFYEAVLALGQQQFEQAKLSWYYAVATAVDLESWASTDVLELYNKAEENIEKGLQMWEEAESYRLIEMSKLPNKTDALLHKMKLDKLFKHISADEDAKQYANIGSQIYVLWGTVLYERSIMEFKLDIPVWEECLEVAEDKFKLAGASPADIRVMLKNHCSETESKGVLGFNIDEIVQAWNEMYDAKRLQSCITSFRLEPLLRRRVSKIYHALEHA